MIKNQLHMISEFIEKSMSTPSLLISSFLTVQVTCFTWMSNTSLFGVSIFFVVILCAIMFIDWGLGVYASLRVDGAKFSPDKLTYTIVKFMTFFMFLFFVNQAKHEYRSYSFAYEVVLVIQVFVLLLIGLREFVSVGEKIDKIWENKPYLFCLIDDLFKIIEKGFKRKVQKAVEDTDFIEEEEEEDNENKQ